VRTLPQWESDVDRRIREAQERGDFDRLPGQGKPLRLGTWRGDWVLAHHILRQAGETLPWISLGRDIEAAQARLQALLRDAATLPRPGSEAPMGKAAAAPPGWRQVRARARERYLREAASLDKLLQEYAFAIPSRQLERGRLPPHIAARQFDTACPPG